MRHALEVMSQQNLTMSTLLAGNFESESLHFAQAGKSGGHYVGESHTLPHISS
jgi:hypothetical protein